jgi:hypothetical protein
MHLTYIAMYKCQHLKKHKVLIQDLLIIEDIRRSSSSQYHSLIEHIRTTYLKEMSISVSVLNKSTMLNQLGMSQ